MSFFVPVYLNTIHFHTYATTDVNFEHVLRRILIPGEKNAYGIKSWNMFDLCEVR